MTQWRYSSRVSRSSVLALSCVLAALAVAVAVRWQGATGSGERAAKPAPTSAAPQRSAATVPDGVAVDRSEPELEAEPEPELPVVPRAALADRRDLGTGESEETLASLPTRIDYPLQDKYRNQVWSDVPYELLAAQDDREGEQAEGARRLFVAVVDPKLSDGQIERLVRDFRARHREAEVLRIRIFDSREAASRPSWSDGGAARREHLVADLYREPGRERFLLRGREVRP